MCRQQGHGAMCCCWPRLPGCSDGLPDRHGCRCGGRPWRPHWPSVQLRGSRPGGASPPGDLPRLAGQHLVSHAPHHHLLLSVAAGEPGSKLKSRRRAIGLSYQRWSSIPKSGVQRKRHTQAGVGSTSSRALKAALRPAPACAPRRSRCAWRHPPRSCARNSFQTSVPSCSQAPSRPAAWSGPAVQQAGSRARQAVATAAKQVSSADSWCVRADKKSDAQVIQPARKTPKGRGPPYRSPPSPAASQAYAANLNAHDSYLWHCWVSRWREMLRRYGRLVLRGGPFNERGM